MNFHATIKVNLKRRKTVISEDKVSRVIFFKVELSRDMFCILNVYLVEK